MTFMMRSNPARSLNHSLSRHISHSFVALAVLLTTAVACGPAAEEEELSPLEQQQKDIDGYNELTTELEANREEVLGEIAGETKAVGNHLFWQEFRNFAPSLHSKDYETGTETNYDFSIGAGDDANYAASEQLIAHAEATGDSVTYHAWATGAADEPLGQLTVDAPTTEAKWWAYTAYESSVYLVQEIDGEHWLVKWIPGQEDEATPLVSLEQASGAEVGEFWTFAMYEKVMIYVESGRVWSLELIEEEATWMENEQQVRSGAFDTEGAIYNQDDGLFYFAFDDHTAINISESIEASAFEVNETLASTHLYTGSDFFLWGDKLIYVGNGGVFSYGLDDETVVPILLSPRPEVADGKRVDYRYPTVLENGLMFVTGLTSESGAVGADGPIYMVDLKSLGL
jgi:hypothetical protein